MIVYSTTKKGFQDDVINGIVADKVLENLKTKLNINHNNVSEYRSWENSLKCMYMVLIDDDISDDVKVAIEYQLPLTAKRVDFLITGKDDENNDHVMIIELKQWEKATRTSRRDIVNTYVGQSNRDVVHPSYQAYSYAKTIENFNESVQLSDIKLHPCAYLHNFKEEYKEEIDNSLYKDVVEIAPLFLKQDTLDLRKFIKKFIKKPDDGSVLYKIENGRIKPSKVLQDSLASMIRGNEEFFMLDEQKVAFETINKLVSNALRKNEKYTVIVEGGPGTGKSVIAINLLSRLINNNHNINYVSKNAAPRNVYFEKLKQDDFKANYIKNLFKGSGSYISSASNTFDCLIVDEAHRLNDKSGLYANLGENQIKEVIDSSRVSVFFIDEDQIVTTKDIGSIALIKKYAEELNSTVFHDESTNLVSQFRCNGSDGYIAFLDNLLNIRDTANYSLDGSNYDFKIFENPNELREELRLKNLVSNKSRMLAGYCYEWKSRKDKDAYDILLEDGFMARWNFSGTTTWAIDKESFDQVGCIHTSQGLEFDYVGVFIGKDIIYRNGQILVDSTKRAKSDASLKGQSKFPVEHIERIVKNTYKTLMTRGQKGCYVYCEDEELREYIKNIIK